MKSVMIQYVPKQNKMNLSQVADHVDQSVWRMNVHL